MIIFANCTTFQPVCAGGTFSIFRVWTRWTITKTACAQRLNGWRILRILLWKILLHRMSILPQMWLNGNTLNETDLSNTTTIQQLWCYSLCLYVLACENITCRNHKKYLQNVKIYSVCRRHILHIAKQPVFGHMNVFLFQSHFVRSSARLAVLPIYYGHRANFAKQGRHFHV